MKVCIALLACAALPLAAQELSDFQAGPGAQGRPWSLLLGAGVRSGPAYPGADANRTSLEPLFNLEAGRYYLGASRIDVGFGGGAHLWRRDGFTWDVGLGVGDRRPESRSWMLAGMGDRRAVLWAGTGLQWRLADGWRAGLTLAHGLRDEAGNRGTASLGKGFRLAQDWFLAAGVHGTWADAQATAYDFGITDAQAQARAALVAGGEAAFTPAEAGPYAPRSGIRDYGARLGLGYRPAPGWIWSLRVDEGTWAGDARNSPLVLRKTYLSAGVGCAHVF